jgi:tetratricopeptide (TPR) repeat protein
MRRIFPALSLIFLLSALFGTAVNAQAPPAVSATPVDKLSVSLAENLRKFKIGGAITPQQREQAYARLLEGQRYIWLGNPARGSAGSAANFRNARAALLKALEIDPTLSEVYTALAELVLTSPTASVDEAIDLAKLGVETRTESFGSHRILARLYTFKSKLNGGDIDPEASQNAINEWLEVTRLDPKNAEAWAFLSEFYGNSGQSDKQIDALKKWVGSATPVDSQFYRQMMGGSENLTPENATLRLASTLIKSGRSREAIEIVGQMVADDPENTDAIDLLREAVETSDSQVSSEAVTALEQAVYANPSNTALIDLLAQTQFRAGKTDEAVRLLMDAIKRISAADKTSAAALALSLGDIYFGSERYDEAAMAYESGLSIKGIKPNTPAPAAEREFIISVIDRVIRTYKSADRSANIPLLLQRGEKLLGAGDPFIEREKVSYLRETGNRAAALQAVRAARVKTPDDYSLIRMEATTLTEIGKVDEAVSLIRGLLNRKLPVQGTGIGSGRVPGSINVSPQLYDDFSNLLFISQLYAKANLGKQAAAAADEAFNSAVSPERKQIAKLTLATAQEMTGSFNAAEATLRGILSESPGNPIALNNLGYFLLERNERIDEALTLIQKALAVDPTNPSYIDSLGWAYFKLGKLPEAEKSLRSAARIDSSSETIQEHLGDVLNKQGKAAEARRSWQRALILASDTADIARIKAKLK